MNEMKPIRILITDDHAVVRSGLSRFLLVNPDLELVGEAADGADAVRMAALHRPDVILMDLVMPGTDGITATREIRTRYPEIKVIVLTSFAEEALVQGALQAGAVGYLQKNISAAELGSAIRSANAGHKTLSTEAVQILADSVTQANHPADRLTEREEEVLALLVNGLSNAVIAERLCVSQGTVKFHVSNIYHKLGVSSRIEAVKLALERHLV
jgi:NarL family two-component system response regulator LiaR